MNNTRKKGSQNAFDMVDVIWERLMNWFSLKKKCTIWKWSLSQFNDYKTVLTFFIVYIFFFLSHNSKVMQTTSKIQIRTYWKKVFRVHWHELFSLRVDTQSLSMREQKCSPKKSIDEDERKRRSKQVFIKHLADCLFRQNFGANSMDSVGKKGRKECD